MGCSDLLCGRFADSQESRFQASKHSNMSSALLEVVHSADIHEFCIQAKNVQIWTVSNCKGVYLLIVRNGIFRSRKVQINAVQSCKRVDFLKFTNSGFRVRNVEICAVLSSNEIDLLMLMKRVFWQINGQKCAE